MGACKTSRDEQDGRGSKIRNFDQACFLNANEEEGYTAKKSEWWYKWNFNYHIQAMKENLSVNKRLECKT